MYYNIYGFPGYRPIYKLNNKKRTQHNIFFPFLISNPNREKINLQVFYNTLYNKLNGIPIGTTYKYTIPKSIDEQPDLNYSSISQRQKRRSLMPREFFGNLENNINKNKNDDDFYLFTMITIVIICIFIKNLNN